MIAEEREALQQLEEIRRKFTAPRGTLRDLERAGIEAERVVTQLLRDIGYGSVADAWQQIERY